VVSMIQPQLHHDSHSEVGWFSQFMAPGQMRLHIKSLQQHLPGLARSDAPLASQCLDVFLRHNGLVAMLNRFCWTLALLSESSA